MRDNRHVKWRLTRLDGEFCVTWDDVRPDGSTARRRYRLGTGDSRQAQTLAASRYAQLTRPVTKTVGDLWEAYQSDKAGKAVLETMKHTWKALEPIFSALDGDAVALEHCRSYAEQRARTLVKGSASKLISQGTIHTELGHLRSILVWARDARLIDYAPKIERPSKPDPMDYHVTKSEAERLIAGAKAPHIALAIRLMLGTGARVAAALDLTWDRVDFVRGTIRLANPFEQQARKGRATVPMNRTLRAALEYAKEAALTPFVIEYAGDRISSIKTGMRAAAKAARLPEVTPHVLRHSAAVWMAEAGHNMEEIAQFLGHSDANITRKVYARYSPTHLRSLADSLDF